MIIQPSAHVIEIRDETHWHELRATNIGASEVAGLFDADDGIDHSFVTRFELWITKSGKHSVEWEDAERMFWGRTLEDAIGEGLRQKHEMRLTKNKYYFTNPNVPGMGCTPDFIADPWQGKQGQGVVQIKNVDYITYKRWREENGDEPSMQYILQVQHELACTGLKWGVLAVLVGGNRLIIFTLDRHDGAIGKIEKAVTTFWQSVRDGIEPKAVADDYEILREIYPETDGTTLDLTGDNELPQICASFNNFREQRKVLEKQEKEEKAKILQKIGKAGVALCQGFAITQKTSSRKSYVVNATTATRLDVKET